MGGGRGKNGGGGGAIIIIIMKRVEIPGRDGLRRDAGGQEEVSLPAQSLPYALPPVAAPQHQGEDTWSPVADVHSPNGRPHAKP